MSITPDAASTRQRLVEAAAHIFAEQGFAGASVREICAKAGANVAAINYHFGGKEALFGEVLRLPIHRLEATIPAFSEPDLPLTAALRRMYLGMLAPLRSGSAESAAMRVVVQSFTQGRDCPRPDSAVLQRHHAAIDALVRRNLPAGVDSGAVNALCGALIGMAMHAVMGQMHDHPGPRMWSGDGDAAIDGLADRLARYGTAIIASEATP